MNKLISKYILCHYKYISFDVFDTLIERKVNKPTDIFALVGKNILGEEAERFNVTLLLDNGVDMHSYQPTIRDIAIAGSGDLFIYVGGESDAWVRDALKEAKNKDLKLINLMDVLGNSVKEEEVVECPKKPFWDILIKKEKKQMM